MKVKVPLRTHGQTANKRTVGQSQKHKLDFVYQSELKTYGMFAYLFAFDCALTAQILMLTLRNLMTDLT